MATFLLISLPLSILWRLHQINTPKITNIDYKQIQNTKKLRTKTSKIVSFLLNSLPLSIPWGLEQINHPKIIFLNYKQIKSIK